MATATSTNQGHFQVNINRFLDNDVDFWFIIQFLQWDPDTINGSPMEGFGNASIQLANVPGSKLVGPTAQGNFMMFPGTGPNNYRSLKMQANKDSVKIGMLLNSCPNPNAYSGGNYRACRLKVWSYADPSHAEDVLNGNVAPSVNNIDDETREFSLNWEVKELNYYSLKPCIADSTINNVEILPGFLGTEQGQDERWNVSKDPCSSIKGSNKATYIGEAEPNETTPTAGKVCLSHKFNYVAVDTDDYAQGSAPVAGFILKCDLNCLTVDLTEDSSHLGVDECYELVFEGTTHDETWNDNCGAFNLKKLYFFDENKQNPFGVCQPGLYTCDPSEIENLESGEQGTCVGLQSLDEHHISDALTNALASAGWGEGIGEFEITGFKGSLEGVGVTGGGKAKEITITRMKGAGHTRDKKCSLPGGASSYNWSGKTTFETDAADRNGVIDSVSFWYNIQNTTSQSFDFFQRWKQEIEMDVNKTQSRAAGGEDVEYTVTRAWDPEYVRLFAEKTMRSAASLKCGGNINKMFEVGLSLNVSQVKTEKVNEWGNAAGSSSFNVGCSAYMQWSDIMTGLLENWTDDKFKDKLRINIDMGSAGGTSSYSWEEIKDSSTWTGENNRAVRGKKQAVLQTSQNAFENGLFSVQKITASYSIKKANSWGLTCDFGTIYDPNDGWAFDVDPVLSFSGKIPKWDKVKYTLDWTPISSTMAPELAIAYKPDDIELTETEIGGQPFTAYASIGVNVDASPFSENSLGGRFQPSYSFHGKFGQTGTGTTPIDALKGFEYDINLAEGKLKLSNATKMTTNPAGTAQVKWGWEAQVGDPNAPVFTFGADYKFEKRVGDFGRWGGHLKLKANAVANISAGGAGTGGGIVNRGVNGGVYGQCGITWSNRILEWMGFPFNLVPSVGIGFGASFSFNAKSSFGGTGGGFQSVMFIGPIGWNLAPVDKLRNHLEQRRNAWLGEIPLIGTLAAAVPLLGQIGSKENELQYLARAGSFRAYMAFGQAADNCKALRDKAKVAMFNKQMAVQNAMAKDGSVPMCLPQTGNYSLSPDGKTLYKDNKPIKRINSGSFGGALPQNGSMSNCRCSLTPGGPISSKVVKEMINLELWPQWLQANPPCSCMRVEFQKYVGSKHTQLHDINKYTDMPDYIGDILDIVDNYVYNRIMTDCAENRDGTYNDFNNSGFKDGLAAAIVSAYRDKWEDDSWGHAGKNLTYCKEAGTEDENDDRTHDAGRDGGGCQCEAPAGFTKLWASNNPPINPDAACVEKCIRKWLKDASAKQNVIELVKNKGIELFNLTKKNCCSGSLGKSTCQQIYDSYTKWLIDYYAEYDNFKYCMLSDCQPSFSGRLSFGVTSGGAVTGDKLCCEQYKYRNLYENIYSKLPQVGGFLQQAYDSISLIPLNFVYKSETCKEVPLYELYDSDGRAKGYDVGKLVDGEYQTTDPAAPNYAVYAKPHDNDWTAHRNATSTLSTSPNQSPQWYVVGSHRVKREGYLYRTDSTIPAEVDGSVGNDAHDRFFALHAQGGAGTLVSTDAGGGPGSGTRTYCATDSRINANATRTAAVGYDDIVTIDTNLQLMLKEISKGRGGGDLLFVITHPEYYLWNTTRSRSANAQFSKTITDPWGGTETITVLDLSAMASEASEIDADNDVILPAVNLGGSGGFSTIGELLLGWQTVFSHMNTAANMSLATLALDLLTKVKNTVVSGPGSGGNALDVSIAKALLSNVANDAVAFIEVGRMEIAATLQASMGRDFPSGSAGNVTHGYTGTGYRGKSFPNASYVTKSYDGSDITSPAGWNYVASSDVDFNLWFEESAATAGVKPGNAVPKGTTAGDFGTMHHSPTAADTNTTTVGQANYSSHVYSWHPIIVGSIPSFGAAICGLWSNIGPAFNVNKEARKRSLRYHLLNHLGKRTSAVTSGMGSPFLCPLDWLKNGGEAKLEGHWYGFQAKSKNPILKDLNDIDEVMATGGIEVKAPTLGGSQERFKKLLARINASECPVSFANAMNKITAVVGSPDISPEGNAFNLYTIYGVGGGLRLGQLNGSPAANHGNAVCFASCGGALGKYPNKPMPVLAQSGGGYDSCDRPNGQAWGTGFKTNKYWATNKPPKVPNRS